jgi:MoaA/NifB/PqqE/SkfB family radical SAM enzyme
MQKYCIQPFNNIRIDVTEGDIIQYKPCCHYTFDTNFSNVDSYLESDELKNLQHHFLTQNELPSGCKLCNDVELYGNKTSTRLLHLYTDPILETKIEKLEISPGNICNLKCIMCNPHSSSALSSEYVKLGWIKKHVVTEQDDQVISVLNQLNSLKSVSIIGGEFFLSKKNLEILDLLIEKKLEVKLTTNATELTKTHLEKLKKIHKLDLILSIDGVGPIYEFIRYPALWGPVSDNVKNLKEILPQASLTINVVIQPLNLQFINELIQYANQNRIKVMFTLLTSPEWLGWNILTQDESLSLMNHLRQELLSSKMAQSQRQSIEGFIRHLTQSKFNPESREMFVKKMSAILTLRKIPDEQLRIVFGILDKLYNETKHGIINEF